MEPANYILPEQERVFFKIPLGKILKTKNEISNFINQIKTQTPLPIIVSVGDATSQVLLEMSLKPTVIIIDSFIQRKKIEPLDIEEYLIIKEKNEAGKISKDVWLKILQVLKNKDNNTIIKIDGEEDLLVLPTILEAPLDSKVLYGQPNEGLVVVTVTEKVKREVKELMQKMVKIDENRNNREKGE